MNDPKLRRRLKRRKNIKGKVFFYCPCAASHNINLRAGESVYTVDDPIADKLIDVVRVEDCKVLNVKIKDPSPKTRWETVFRKVYIPQPDAKKYTVFINDLTIN